MRALNIPGGKWQAIPARLYLGIIKPRRKILGMEFSGKIEAIGKEVTRFKVGDELFGSTTWSNFGAYSEYKCMDENDSLTLKPDNLTYKEAATIPCGGFTTLGLLKKANIKKGDKILIYGASGSIGTFAVQIASYLKAEVTGVCSMDNIELVKSLGAKKVIDYTKEDFTKNSEKYDVILDAVDKIPKKEAIKSLKSGGIYLNIHNDAVSTNAKDSIPILEELKQLAEEGKIKGIIDKIYSIDQIVEAHKYVDKGHKKGNVVITVSRDNKASFCSSKPKD